jgi:hypothetical protein
MSYVVIKCFGGVEHDQDRFLTVADSLDYEQVEPCKHRHMSFREFDEAGEAALRSSRCAGCGGAIEFEPWRVGNLSESRGSRSSRAPWLGGVAVMDFDEGAGVVHAHPECIAVARC